MSGLLRDQLQRIIFRQKIDKISIVLEIVQNWKHFNSDDDVGCFAGTAVGDLVRIEGILKKRALSTNFGRARHSKFEVFSSNSTHNVCTFFSIF